jgi:hypothetical protein
MSGGGMSGGPMGQADTGDVGRGGARARPGELWRTLAGLVVVLGGAAALLAALDAVPAWLAGEPRDVRRCASVEEAERRLRTRLLVPGYFPDTLRWPPRTVRVVQGALAGAALELDGVDGSPRLLLVQAARPGDAPARLLPEATGLDAVPVALRGTSGTLRRVIGPDGEVWQEVVFVAGGRQVVLRLRGSVEQAVRMAKSTREEQ